MDGRTWESPLPAHTAVRVADFADTDGWEVLDPLHSPKILTSYLSVLMAEQMGVSPEVAAVQVLKRPMTDLIACVTEYGS